MKDLMDYNPGWDKAVENKLREQYLGELELLKSFLTFDDKIIIMRMYKKSLKWLNKGYEGMLEMLVDDGRIFLYV